MGLLVRPIAHGKESLVTQQSAVPDFGPVERKILWEQVAEQLMDMLRDRRLRPGDKLPPERELAAMMQVSRPSLREALRALSLMNVLEVRQGAGTFVTSLETELLVEHLDFVLSLDESSLIELFEARKIVEIGIAGLAAQRITGEELAELEAGLVRSQDALHHPVDFLQADEQLHKTITNAARNPIMSRVIDSISRLLMVSRSRTVEITRVREQTVEDHRAIVAALKRRDPEAAQEAMLQHLNNVEQGLLDSHPFATEPMGQATSPEASTKNLEVVST
jgi:GntR family transcriptional repressor for pyruvate dehydrogenase complex